MYFIIDPKTTDGNRNLDSFPDAIKRPDDAPSKCRTDMKAESRQLSPLKVTKTKCDKIFLKSFLDIKLS